jgi:O-antigen ligase
VYPTPTLWLEIALGGLLALAILWTHVEYGLFLYGLALGFPDLAYPVGSTVNLRLEDGLIVLFLARAFLWAPARPSPGQRRILGWQAIFLALCVLSIAVESACGNPPSGYDAARLAGCAVILGVLPSVVSSQRRLRFLVAGLVCGGVALAIQVHQHIGESSLHEISNFQQLKSAAAFDTWNPNTIGHGAILLAFAAGLGATALSRTPTAKILCTILALGFGLLPALVYVRGTAISVAAGFVLFLCLLRRWKWVLLFAAVCLAVLLYLRSSQHSFLEDATSVNLATGEGLSHRQDRWQLTFQAIRSHPVIGQGFGQELDYLTLLGSEGRAHNTYLSVWLELGAGGLVLFLAVILQFVRAGFSLYRNLRFQSQGALILALMFALSLDSLGLATLYWEKLPAIALALATAVLGVCERNEFEHAPQENLIASPVPSTQAP